MSSTGGFAMRVAVALWGFCLFCGQWDAWLWGSLLVGAAATADAAERISDGDLPITTNEENGEDAVEKKGTLEVPEFWEQPLSDPSPPPKENAKGALPPEMEEKKQGPEPSPPKNAKTDLLAMRKRAVASTEKFQTPTGKIDSWETDTMPRHKGAEEMFLGGMLMVLAGIMELSSVRGRALMFMSVVFALVGLLCALFGIFYQISSYRRRKRWIKNQGSILDQIKH